MSLAWLTSLGGAIAVVATHVVVVACEAALIKVRFSHFNPDLLDHLREHKTITWLLDHPTRALRVLRLTAGLCWLGYWACLWPVAVAPVALLTGTLGELASGALILALLAVQFVAVEQLPRSLGLRSPSEVLRGASVPVRVLTVLAKPFLGIVSPIGQAINSLGGRKEVTELEALDYEEQIEMLGEEAPEMSDVAQTILKNALQMRDLEVSDVLLPRHQVKFFDLYLSPAENLRMARASGHTRFPLCEGDLDRCVGMIHIKDLFRFEGELNRMDFRRHKREIIRMSADLPLEDALTQLLSHKAHMALVIDEFRGTEGVLTLERVLEQLVGDIRDEFDTEEETLIRANPEGEALVSGLTPLHELAERLGIELSNEEVSTLGGLITSELGRIPEAGEELVVEGMAVRVTAVDDKRVIEAEVRPYTPREEEDDDIADEDSPLPREPETEEKASPASDSDSEIKGS